ncbi:MAG: SDR family oxidoreductase [Candidatus Schekmanbacteria bacterium]|nr:SDR family oxidoreductase [Candidatus Schekmanbacteria bacterium]
MPIGFAPNNGRTPVALVTGAACRVGRSIALRLARDGADVAVHFRTSAMEAEAVAAEIRGLGRRSVTVAGDHTCPDQVATFVRAAREALGPVDVLVNNASIYSKTPIRAATAAQFRGFLDANLMGPFHCVQAVLPDMLAGRGGLIVNLVDDVRPPTGYVPYGVSKAALVALTLGLARELAPDVRVNAVCPGAVLLPGDTSEERREAILRKIPLGRMGTPEDVAAAVSFLVFGSDYLTGHVLTVDGGRFLG